MSSGHAAGLQGASDFRETEEKILKKRRRDAQAMVDRHGMGETVYRDEHGKRKANGSQQDAKIKQMTEAEQTQLNKGRVQREHEGRFQQELNELKEGTFARHADDSQLEELRKEEIREGDPMAAYAAKKKVRTKHGPTARPVYKGPAPKPNRFGIRPGYRWDGVDRGNGFEDKVLAQMYSSQRKKDDAYRWSSADM
jgi:pre-mRNA-splicing factor CWC26